MTDEITGIGKRISNDKETLIEQLKKLPIISVACDKTGIGRTTYYRWRKEDLNFSSKADEALQNGRNLINDMAESQLISGIKDKNMTAIIFWLKNNHEVYKPKRFDRSNVVSEEHGELTPEMIAEMDRMFEMNSRCEDCGKSLSNITSILPGKEKG